jgi:hypothetical protein
MNAASCRCPGSPTRRNQRRWQVGIVLATIVGAALLLAPVHAQQPKNGGGTLGPATGTVGGGATGAANPGGASGTSNPSPGGAPSTLGSPGQSAGPRGTETSRPGYLGGRSTATEPPAPPPPPPAPGEVVTITDYSAAAPPAQGGAATITEYNATLFGDCPTPTVAANPQQRMSGNNGGRIEAVARYLAHRPGANDSTARYLIANMQEELEKPQPDLTLIGTYFGIASRTRVTQGLVKDVSASLCAPVAGSAAQSIAEIAEAQRVKLRDDYRKSRRSR